MSMTHLTLVLLHVDLVSEDNEGKVLRVMRGCLNEELVAPRVERLEGLGRVDVVDEDAAVGAAIECDAERLEALLAGSIPQLQH